MNKHANKDYGSRDYFNISQYRSDLWHDLKFACQHLKNDKDVEANRSNVESCLSGLELIEQYWAFPGLDLLEDITVNYRNKEYEALCDTVNDTLKILVTEAYRSDPALLISPTDLEGAKVDRAKLEDPSDQQEEGRNYYEILIVDDLDVSEQKDLKKKLMDARSDKD